MQLGKIIIITSTTLLLLFVFSIVVLIISGTGSIEEKSRIEYIQGMPCLIYNNGYGGSITWDKWEGR